jgi:hypothetical protein
MPPIARSFLSIVGGMAVAVLVVILMDKLGAMIHPLPAGFDPRVTAQVNAHIATAPFGAMLVMVSGWVLAPFTGGLVASKLSGRPGTMYVWSIMLLFLSTTLVNLGTYVHPPWMWLVATAGIPGAGWLAARLVSGPARAA